MNEFTKLRERARVKRDKLISHAKAEYEATLVQIATLEQDLLGKLSSRHQKISACIESVIPRDRAFTTVDIMTALEALDPGRVWRKRSIDNHLHRLRERGIVRRIRQCKNNEPAIYALADAKVDTKPFDNLKLPDVIRQVLTRPMTATEIVVAMLEAGYETAMTKAALRNAVGLKLKEGGFRCEGGKWSVSPS